MRTILIVIISLVLSGCGSRKVDNTSFKQQQTKNEFTEDKQRTETLQEKTGESSAKTERKNFNLSIEPFGDYLFRYNGIEFKGNAKVTIGSSDEKKEEQTKIKEVVKTVIDRYVKNITVTTYKSVYNQKK